MTKAEATNLALDFLARNFETLASLAWPAVVLLGLSMFKREIVALLPHLSIKHGESEFKFLFDRALKADAFVPPAEASPAAGETLQTSEFERLLAISPTTALRELQVELENKLLEAMQALPDYQQMPISQRRLIPRGRPQLHYLSKHQVLPPEFADLAAKLISAGNSARHGSPVQITEEEARQYRRMVDRVIAYLDREGAKRSTQPASTMPPEPATAPPTSPTSL